jgi:hypothetical protein
MELGETMVRKIRNMNPKDVTSMHIREGGKSRQCGSAFVISILVLFVLSVLGLALMLTTTTETDISVNYRWGEMAFFNADAALEYGKNILALYAVADTDFINALPPARGPAEMRNAPPGGCSLSTPPCRDYQYQIEQDPTDPASPIIFIGKVLVDPRTSTRVEFDLRAPPASMADMLLDMEMQGTVTLWVRRPIAGDRDYGWCDGCPPDSNDRVILTAEGTAPNFLGAQGGRPGSLRRLEMTVRVPTTGMSGDRYADVTKASDTDAVMGSNAAQAGGTTGVVR